MNEKKIIEEILNLPVNFYKSGEKTMYDLLKETGYFEMEKNISEEAILSALYNNPILVDQWLLWSENKRVTYGHYFRSTNDNRYIVGVISTDSNEKKLVYFEKEKACAAFIKKEIEDLNKNW